MEGLYYARRPHCHGHGPGSRTRGHRRSEGGRDGHRRPPGAIRGTRDRGLPCSVRAHPELLPRWPGGRPTGARWLVFRTVVEASTGRRGLGHGLGPAVRRDVLRNGRRSQAPPASRTATAPGSIRASTPTMTRHGRRRRRLRRRRLRRRRLRRIRRLLTLRQLWQTLRQSVDPRRLWQAGHQNRLRPSISAVRIGVSQIRHGSPDRRYT